MCAQSCLTMQFIYSKHIGTIHYAIHDIAICCIVLSASLAIYFLSSLTMQLIYSKQIGTIHDIAICCIVLSTLLATLHKDKPVTLHNTHQNTSEDPLQHTVYIYGATSDVSSSARYNKGKLCTGIRPTIKKQT